jgi:predicted nucleic acid-binding Zn ribbon protein
MLRFKCPECSTLIEVEERFAGQTGKCRECGAPVTVPSLQEMQPTGLEALLGKPDAGVYDAYNKAPDATWEDPATKPKAEKEEEEAVPLPEIPEEILAAAKARKRRTMQYVMAAVVLTLVLLVLALPLLVPKPKQEEAPATAAPAMVPEQPAPVLEQPAAE